MTYTYHPPSPQQQKGYPAYLRVSTPKQGEGVSLLTQREGIARFAAEKNLLVTGWYEEKETAARRGRPIFAEILKQLRSGKAEGLIVFKVDRGARNLKDWSDLGELIDRGIPVYFASEGIDMLSRFGRLAADIQAVVAADFIRNLKEEAKRGIRKRMEQGLRPNGAPMGYLDRGRGKLKTLDPTKAALVRLAFTWYRSGEYTLRKLVEMLNNLGLRNRRDRKLTLSGISYLLRNPFYMGYLECRKTGELLPGKHEVLIDQQLFFAVQAKLKTRVWPRRLKHAFTYSRMLKCSTCGKSLVGSLAKGRVYYRCMTMSCPTVSVREDRLVLAVSESVPDRALAAPYYALPPNIDFIHKVYN